MKEDKGKEWMKTMSALASEIRDSSIVEGY